MNIELYMIEILQILYDDRVYQIFFVHVY